MKRTGRSKVAQRVAQEIIDALVEAHRVTIDAAGTPKKARAAINREVMKARDLFHARIEGRETIFHDTLRRALNEHFARKPSGIAPAPMSEAQQTKPLTAEGYRELRRQVREAPAPREEPSGLDPLSPDAFDRAPVDTGDVARGQVRLWGAVLAAAELAALVWAVWTKPSRDAYVIVALGCAVVFAIPLALAWAQASKTND